LMPASDDAGPILDEQAKAAYKDRLADLRDDLEEAQAWADEGRAARAREEIELIAAELASAVGLGGRDRKTASTAEKARLNVTRSIRSALERIAENSSALGDHLSATVRTGTFCAYLPDPHHPIRWET
ncbi:MAG: transcriptional regulator, partial [Actinomycetota bacterium]